MAGTFEKMSVQRGRAAKDAQVYASEQQKTTVLLVYTEQNVGAGLLANAVCQ
jgi:hypothetical protein